MQTAAWSVPAITVAGAAPAFATSSDQVRLSLVSQEWVDAELFVQLKVENLSATSIATSLAVTLLFEGTWRDGAIIALDSIADDFEAGWSGTLHGQLNSSRSTATLTLASLAADGESIVGFRVNRVGLSSNTPYGAAVGAQISNPGAGFAVAPDSLTGFITKPKPAPISLDGSCGLLSLIGPGFTLRAGEQAVPAGSVIDITTDGVVSADVLPIIWDANNTAAPGLAEVNVIGEKTFTVTLNETLEPGSSMHVRYVLSLNVISRQTAVLKPPAGHTFPAGSKTTGEFNSTLVLCVSS